MNDQTYVTAVKKALLDCTELLDSVKWLYLTNPDKDFTRDRKSTLKDSSMYACKWMAEPCRMN